jgi:hypothetical protein
MRTVTLGGLGAVMPVTYGQPNRQLYGFGDAEVPNAAAEVQHVMMPIGATGDLVEVVGMRGQGMNPGDVVELHYMTLQAQRRRSFFFGLIGGAIVAGGAVYAMNRKSRR